MDKLITFSVAAYNVEKYLPKLFDSIIDPIIINNIEILIVDDGSSDKTVEISKKYEKIYPDSVRVISKENGGHGSTINVGMREAKGKYFRALDGDDWVNTPDLVKLVDRLEKTEADMVLTDFLTCYSNGRIVRETFRQLVDGMEYDFRDIVSKVNWMRYHTVIYKTSILKKHDIKLDEHCFYVDSEFMIFPIPYIKTLVYYNLAIYCYRYGDAGQSVSSSSRIKHSEDSYKVFESLAEMYKSLPDNISKEHRKYIEHGISGHCIWHYRTIMTFPKSREKKKELIDYEKKIKNISREIYLGMEDYGKSSRLIKVMRRSNYRLYNIICTIKKIKNS